MARHRGKFDKNKIEPYELSRSRIENFVKCKACFYMENKKYSKARKELISISKEEYLYLLFYLLSLTPILWKFFHRRKIKEKLTRVFFKKK